MPPRSPGEALEPGRKRGQVLGVLPAEPARGADGEAVLGEGYRLVDLRDPAHQVVEQPVQPVGRDLPTLHKLPLSDLPCSGSVISDQGVAAVPPDACEPSEERPRCQPRCMAARRSRTSSGEWPERSPPAAG